MLPDGMDVKEIIARWNAEDERERTADDRHPTRPTAAGKARQDAAASAATGPAAGSARPSSSASRNGPQGQIDIGEANRNGSMNDDTELKEEERRKMGGQSDRRTSQVHSNRSSVTQTERDGEGKKTERTNDRGRSEGRTNGRRGESREDEGSRRRTTGDERRHHSDVNDSERGHSLSHHRSNGNQMGASHSKSNLRDEGKKGGEKTEKGELTEGMQDKGGHEERRHEKRRDEKSQSSPKTTGVRVSTNSHASSSTNRRSRSSSSDSSVDSHGIDDVPSSSRKDDYREGKNGKKRKGKAKRRSHSSSSGSSAIDSPILDDGPSSSRGYGREGGKKEKRKKGELPIVKKEPVDDHEPPELMDYSIYDEITVYESDGRPLRKARVVAESRQRNERESWEKMEKEDREMMKKMKEELMNRRSMDCPLTSSRLHRALESSDMYERLTRRADELNERMKREENNGKVSGPIRTSMEKCSEEGEIECVIGTADRAIGDGLPSKILVIRNGAPEWFDKKIVPKPLLDLERQRCSQLDVVEYVVRMQYGDSDFSRCLPNRYKAFDDGREIGEWEERRLALRQVEKQWRDECKTAELADIWIEDWSDQPEDKDLKKYKYSTSNEYSTAVTAEIGKTATLENMKCKKKCRCTLDRTSSKYTYNCPCRMHFYNGLGMFTECTSDCSCGVSCHNRSVQDGRELSILIFRLPGIGWSIRVLSRVKTNEFVLEFSGMMQMPTEGTPEPSVEYDCYLPVPADVNDWTTVKIRPLQKGNEGRFVNHSCRPNCSASVSCVKRIGRLPSFHVGFYANHDIYPGMEITVDYMNGEGPSNSEPWKYFPNGCKCGEEHCRFTEEALERERTRRRKEVVDARKEEEEERKKAREDEERRKEDDIIVDGSEDEDKKSEESTVQDDRRRKGGVRERDASMSSDDDGKRGGGRVRGSMEKTKYRYGKKASKPHDSKDTVELKMKKADAVSRVTKQGGIRNTYNRSIPSYHHLPADYRKRSIEDEEDEKRKKRQHRELSMAPVFSSTVEKKSKRETTVDGRDEEEKDEEYSADIGHEMGHESDKSDDDIICLGEFPKREKKKKVKRENSEKELREEERRKKWREEQRRILDEEDAKDKERQKKEREEDDRLEKVMGPLKWRL